MVFFGRIRLSFFLEMRKTEEGLTRRFEEVGNSKEKGETTLLIEVF